jgi:cyclase
MLRPRIIPCLLLHKGGLVKTQKFGDAKYLGDPLNAVKIFNEKEADELIVLDIDASVNGRDPDFALISKLAEECRMPFCYGGGIKSAEQASRLVDMGVEKVAVSASAVSNPALLSEIATAVGQQSVVAVIDVKRRAGMFAKGFEVCTHNSRVKHPFDPVVLAQQFQNAGAGEIVVNSVDRDGSMAGYDLEMARDFRQKLQIPLTFLGGAGSLGHIEELVSTVGVVGAAAGSLFVFKGKYRAVLINYPTPLQKSQLFEPMNS